MENEDVKAIIMAAGGDYAIEMLDYLDFEEMKNLSQNGYKDFQMLRLWDI